MISESYIQFLISDKYLDFKDIENPIKRKISDTQYVMTDLSKFTYYEMHVNNNEYELYDNLIWSDTVTKTGEFLTFDKNTQGVLPNNSDDNFMIIDFKQSDKVNQYERHVYTFFDLMGNIGGFFEIFEIAFAVFVGYFSSKIYEHSLLNGLKSSTVSVVNL